MTTTYENISTVPVLGHDPGTTFDAELDPEHEARLLRSHLRVIREVGTNKRRPSKPAGAATPRKRRQTKRGGS